MKKLFFYLLLFAAIQNNYAQVPQKFNYQGVCRDTAGAVIKNQNIGIKISILQGSPAGTAVYSEKHITLSDSRGIFSIVVGGGTVLSGNISSINWGGDIYFVKTEIDQTGGNNFQFIGTSQLLSVPYSLYSETTGDTSAWKKNGSNIYFGDSVGIGTPSPNSKFEVIGNSRFVGGDVTLVNNNFLLTNGDSVNVWGSYTRKNIIATGFDSGLSKDFLNIGIPGSSTAVYRFPDGNVGIGTAAPSQKLSVSGVIESTTGGIKFPDGTIQTTAVSVASGNPAGTILSFAGATSPTGYLVCDGSAVSRTTYATLYAVIGNAWGSGDGTTTFNLPDLRGRFLRGVDGSAGNDPDKTTRTAINAGGNTGNLVGSIQTDFYKNHSHLLNVSNSNNGFSPSTSNFIGWGATTNEGGGNIWSSSSNTSNSSSIQNSGGNETRPKNANVNFIIKY